MAIYYSPLATDNFNRANEAPLLSPWVNNAGVGNAGLDILSNQVVINNFITPGCETYSGISWPNDQYAQVTNVHTANSQALGPVIRFNASTKNGYGFFNFPVVKGIQLWKYVSGTFTELASSATPANDGDVLTIVAIGTSITALINGVSVLTATDSAVTSGNAGMYMSANASTTIMDSWSAGVASNTPFTATPSGVSAVSAVNNPTGHAGEAMNNQFGPLTYLNQLHHLNRL